ncbi:MAG TPA: outer membrane beta-barrel protein [Syntrophorhabdus sp.]|nr:outer membrane beta-barrel protein [Syntrophorhabdus sp.]
MRVYTFFLDKMSELYKNWLKQTMKSRGKQTRTMKGVAGTMKRNVSFILAVAGLFVFLMHCSSFAELKLGNLRVYPEIGLEEMHRSNIYQTEHDRKSDFITSILPGIRTEYLFGGSHSLNLEYSGAWRNYARYSSNNYWDNRLRGDLRFRFPGGVDFGVEHRYINNWYERSVFIERQRHYTENVTDAKASYRFADRWKAQLQYTRDDFNMSSSRDEIYSYLSDLYGGSLFYRFTARTSGLIEFQHVVKAFDRSDIYDSTVNQAFLGLSFDPEGKLAGRVKFGYGRKEFDRRLPGRDTRSNTWVADIDLIQNFTKYTSLSFSVLRAFHDDTYYANVPYYRTAAALTLQHYFTRKIGGRAMAWYDRADYQERTPEPFTGFFKERTDKVYSTGIGAFYDIQKYLKVRLDYNYINRDSNFENYSFGENRVMFKIVYSP